jgi:hypothetical protein
VSTKNFPVVGLSPSMLSYYCVWVMDKWQNTDAEASVRMLMSFSGSLVTEWCGYQIYLNGSPLAGYVFFWLPRDTPSSLGNWKQHCGMAALLPPPWMSVAKSFQERTFNVIES